MPLSPRLLRPALTLALALILQIGAARASDLAHRDPAPFADEVVHSIVGSLRERTRGHPVADHLQQTLARTSQLVDALAAALRTGSGVSSPASAESRMLIEGQIKELESLRGETLNTFAVSIR